MRDNSHKFWSYARTLVHVICIKTIEIRFLTYKYVSPHSIYHIGYMRKNMHTKNWHSSLKLTLTKL